MTSLSEDSKSSDHVSGAADIHGFSCPPAHQLEDSHDSLTKVIQSKKDQRVPLRVCFDSNVQSTAWEMVELKKNIRNIVKTHKFVNCLPATADVVFTLGRYSPDSRRVFFTHIEGDVTFTGIVTEEAEAVAKEFLITLEGHRMKGTTEAHFYTWFQ